MEATQPRTALAHKQVLCIESDNNSELLSSKNGLKIMEHRFRSGSGMQNQLHAAENWEVYDEGDRTALNQITDSDLAKMTEAERQAYVELMREMVARRLQMYRRGAVYLK